MLATIFVELCGNPKIGNASKRIFFLLTVKLKKNVASPNFGMSERMSLELYDL